mgnify:FL=1
MGWALTFESAINLNEEKIMNITKLRRKQERAKAWRNFWRDLELAIPVMSIIVFLSFVAWSCTQTLLMGG